MKLFDAMTDKYYWLWREEKKKTQEAEKEIEKLKADLARAKEDHQYDNLIHQKELEDFRKGRWDPNFKPLDGRKK